MLFTPYTSLSEPEKLIVIKKINDTGLLTTNLIKGCLMLDYAFCHTEKLLLIDINRGQIDGYERRKREDYVNCVMDECKIIRKLYTCITKII